jgi:hypothetical protein
MVNEEIHPVEVIPSPPPDPKYIYKNRFQDLSIEEVRSLTETLTGYNITQILKSGLETFSDGGLLLEKYIQYDIDGATKIISFEEEQGEVPDEASNTQAGMRLVYVPELDSEWENEADYNTNLDSVDLSSTDDSIWEVSDRLRSFRLKERTVATIE